MKNKPYVHHQVASQGNLQFVHRTVSALERKNGDSEINENN